MQQEDKFRNSVDVQSKAGASQFLAKFQNSRTAAFFCMAMTECMVTASGGKCRAFRLEFPGRFVREHGDKFQTEVTLERPARGPVWSVVLNTNISFGRIRVLFFGGGWKDFVLANKINIGDYLIFSLVAMSRFIVHVYPPVVDFQKRLHEPHDKSTERPSTGRLSSRSTLHDCGGLRRRRDDILEHLLDPFDELFSDQPVPEAYEDKSQKTDTPAPEEGADVYTTASRDRNSARTQGDGSEICGQRQCHDDFVRDPVPNLAAFPHFVKNLCYTHTQRTGKLGVPVAFVRAHGMEIHDVVKLEGPNSQVMEAKLFTCRQSGYNMTRFHFGTGWKLFQDANKLREGDTLLFSLVAPSHFVVEILEKHSGQWTQKRIFKRQERVRA